MIQDELTEPVEAVLSDAFRPILAELDELQACAEDARGPRPASWRSWWTTWRRPSRSSTRSRTS